MRPKNEKKKKEKEEVRKKKLVCSKYLNLSIPNDLNSSPHLKYLSLRKLFASNMSFHTSTKVVVYIGGALVSFLGDSRRQTLRSIGSS